MFRSAAGLAALLACAVPSTARAQACCAGGSAVTPGRLELHEQALVGIQTRTASVFGSYDVDGRYIGAAPSTSEYDFEQDIFGAVRVLRRGQLAVLVPLQETERATLPDGSHVGGGIGDINLSARYDFLTAGESRLVPGIAILAGVTFPTGTPAETSTAPLAVDATGIGALQGNVAIALEQTFGPWFVNATGIVAQRAPRFGETLGTQTTLLAAGAYTFPNDVALALAVSYEFEPNAKDNRGNAVPFSSTRQTTVTWTLLYPVTDEWRLVVGLFANPPLSSTASNQLAAAGLILTIIRSWS
ncbi:MAG TPA: hypothetical protein VGM06_05225 [Polyangiaceae bacterium]|jgi:hypothetical protein